MNKTLAVLLGIAYVGLLPPTSAQSAENSRKVPLRLSLLNETTNLPSFSRLFSHVNPGLQVGTELYYRRGERSQWLQSLNVSGIYHRQLASSLLVSSELGYRRALGRTLYAELKLGPGYMLNQSADPIYQYGADGYTKTTRLEHKLVATAGAGLGLRLGAWSPFVAYNMLVETPYLLNHSPFLPHQVFQVGVVKNLRFTSPK